MTAGPATSHTKVAITDGNTILHTQYLSPWGGLLDTQSNVLYLKAVATSELKRGDYALMHPVLLKVVSPEVPIF